MVGTNWKLFGNFSDKMSDNLSDKNAWMKNPQARSLRVFLCQTRYKQTIYLGTLVVSEIAWQILSTITAASALPSEVGSEKEKETNPSGSLPSRPEKLYVVL
jgi:hypothetical protein